MASLQPIAEPPAQAQPKKPAPGELEVLRRFVNTYDLEDHTDDIDTPDRLRDWLAERGLIARTERLDEDDVRRARSVREALRSLLLANNGFELDPRALETINNAARSAEVVVAFGDAGAPQLSPTRPGFQGARGRPAPPPHPPGLQGRGGPLAGGAFPGGGGGPLPPPQGVRRARLRVRVLRRLEEPLGHLVRHAGVRQPR